MRPFSVVKQACEHVGFAVDGHFVSEQADVLGGLGGGTERKAHGVAGVVLDQVGHRTFHGCGEAQRLAVLGDYVADPADRGKKTHVQHAVGFVEDERLHGAEVDDACGR